MATLASGEAPKSLFAQWLRVSCVIQGALEAALRSCTESRVQEIASSVELRTQTLKADAACFDDQCDASSDAAQLTLAGFEQLRRWGRETPLRLIGALYVLEGSTLGARVLAPKLAHLGRPDGRGLQYFSRVTESSKRTWPRFCHALDALVLDATTLAEVERGAIGTFEIFLTIAMSILPDPEVLPPQPMSLNREAGPHATTRDPRELTAAVDAGVRTWAEHPYFEARFGMRGRRFTRSDSAWLVTLAGMSQVAASRQLEWLVGLLATRGMPSYLVEAHLSNLHTNLLRAVPERAMRYADLDQLRLRLRDKRLSALPHFDRLASGIAEHPIAHLGPVIAGAVADERNGLDHAGYAVESWLTDRERFSPRSRRLVGEAFCRARAS